MRSEAPSGNNLRSDDSANLAGRLLGAMRKSRQQELDRHLRQAQSSLLAHRPVSSFEEERLELLSAVADDLNDKLPEGSSLHNGRPSQSAEVVAHLWLLRHLARSG